MILNTAVVLVDSGLVTPSNDTEKAELAAKRPVKALVTVNTLLDIVHIAELEIFVEPDTTQLLAE